jgi:hypothetical protein
MLSLLLLSPVISFSGLWVFASMGSSWKKEKMSDIIFGKEERKMLNKVVKVILTIGGGDASLGFVELNGVGASDVSLDSEELNVDVGVSDAYCRICCKIISSI